MKKTFSTIGIFWATALFAQNTRFDIQGKIGIYDAPAKVYLRYRSKDTIVIDSAILENGGFRFTGTATPMPQYAILTLDRNGTGFGYSDYKQFYLDKGAMFVTGRDSLMDAKISNSKVNEDHEKYRLALRPIKDAYKELELKRSANNKQTPANETENFIAEKAIAGKESAINKKFILDNPGSYISLIALESFAYSADYKEIADLFSRLWPAVKQTEAGRKLAERLPRLKAVALGAVAPDFGEADTSGNMIKLSSFRGKYVLIDFWASWCGPCRRENPNISKVFNQYKDEKFTIIGVSLDRATEKSKWIAAIHNDGLEWTQVSDLEFWDSRTAALYAVRGIPQNFLLDPEGRIIAKNLRGKDLWEKMKEIFER